MPRFQFLSSLLNEGSRKNKTKQIRRLKVTTDLNIIPLYTRLLYNINKTYYFKLCFEFR